MNVRILPVLARQCGHAQPAMLLLCGALGLGLIGCTTAERQGGAPAGAKPPETSAAGDPNVAGSDVAGSDVAGPGVAGHGIWEEQWDASAERVAGYRMGLAAAGVPAVPELLKRVTGKDPDVEKQFVGMEPMFRHRHRRTRELLEGGRNASTAGR